MAESAEGGGVHVDADVAAIADRDGEDKDFLLDGGEVAALEETARGEEGVEEFWGFGHAGGGCGELAAEGRGESREGGGGFGWCGLDGVVGEGQGHELPL